jgi:Bacterial regulatory proteins, tetR family
MTVAEVVRRAHVSPKAFYDAFGNREDCFLALFEHAQAYAWGLADEAYRREPGWRGGIRMALARLLMLVEEEPGLAHLWLVDALGGDPRVLSHRARALERFAEVVNRGGDASKVTRRPPSIVAMGVVGGICSVLHGHFVRGSYRPPHELLNPLMSFIVLPYLGPAAATRELGRPMPDLPPAAEGSQMCRPSDQLQGLRMRLTYRTVRVLMAIRECPGSSNREIARRAEVRDAGQISKLLTRLAGLELIENHGDGQAKGAANAWTLTRRGEWLERGTRPVGGS